MSWKNIVIVLIVLMNVGFTATVSAEIKADSPETIKRTQFFFDLFMKGMPEQRNQESEVKEYMVEMRDGAKLYTRVFRPQGEGPWPVIITRDPYQNGSSTAMSKILVRYGYVVVQQDCRGTGNSDGIWQPFLNERNDGVDNANWVAKQTWSNGNIGMFGHSYGAYVQWIIADELPKEVKTLYLSMFGTNRYKQMYQDGMFRHDIYTSWAVTTSGIKTTDSLKDLYQKALNIRPHMEMDDMVFGEKMQWYRDMLTNVSGESDYWKKGNWETLLTNPSKINIPVRLVDGWFDHHLAGTVEGYENLSPKVKQQSSFIIGPWTHMLAPPKSDLQFPNGQWSIMKDAVEWFDYKLKGLAFNKELGAVNTYVVQDGTWQNLKTWPPKSKLSRMYFNTADNNTAEYGKLSVGRKAESKTISYVYDPTDPVSTKGGADLLAWLNPGGNVPQPGPVQQDPPGIRKDIVTFISDTLTEDMMIAGKIKVKLGVSSDAEDTAFTAKIMEVMPDGKAYNIRDGITSLAYRNGAKNPQDYKPGSIVDVNLELWPITWKVKKGSKIRIDISSSNFPTYAVHANIAGPWAEQEQEKVKPAKQTIYIGGKHASFIEIPLATEKEK